MNKNAYFFAQFSPQRRHKDTKNIQSEIRISKYEARNSPQSAWGRLAADTLRWKQIRMFKTRNSKQKLTAESAEDAEGLIVFNHGFHGLKILATYEELRVK